MFFKSDTSLIKKFKVYCYRCKETSVVLAKNEHEIKTYWTCRCGSERFLILGEEKC